MINPLMTQINAVERQMSKDFEPIPTADNLRRSADHFYLALVEQANMMKTGSWQ